MNCREFKELVDSYLSNELLVETNHSVLRHLESCTNCRAVMADHREVRSRLREAVMKADESRIDQQFAVRLRENLRSNSQRRSSFAGIGGLRLALAGAIGLVAIAVGLNFIAPQYADRGESSLNLPASNISNNNALSADTVFDATFERIRYDAVDDHKNCALTHNLEKRPITLDEAAKRFHPSIKDLDKTVVSALRRSFGDDAELVKAHYCLINGRAFAHIVLRHRRKVVSVLMHRDEQVAEDPDSAAKECGTDGALSISCFRAAGFDMFVISDLEMQVNINLAEVLVDPMVKHIREAGTRV
jgi:Predicted transmembrane transcriptional regulator (anti-sigma factor)